MKWLIGICIAGLLFAGCGEDVVVTKPYVEKGLEKSWEGLDKHPGTAYIVTVKGVRDVVVVCYNGVAFVKNSAESQDVHPIVSERLCRAS